MRTVHLIFNAHLDPVWLWPWTAGVDEALNTCGSMCDLLDRHPDLIFTRGESWVYEQVRLYDPSLFRRIKRHVRLGRWSPVGGWYVQPDCNLPGAEGLHQQIKLGQSWFKRHLGRIPRIGYNVDSFGHSAALPDILQAHGQHGYVFMRPMPEERSLPARIFRWRGRTGGRLVTAFRIAGTYNTVLRPTLDNIEWCLSELPPGIEHTMCFLGVGDHGGGPSEELVAWCRANWHSFPGVRFEFSSPERFFRAVAPHRAKLPLVTGELQMHAIGCYSVHRPIKLGVRRAENLLAQAQQAVSTAPIPVRRAAAPRLHAAWEEVCFNHFHDTLGGSCTASASVAAEDQLAAARNVADKIVSEVFRRRIHALPRDLRQRLVFGNYSAAPFADWVEHEPWLEWTHWQKDWCLRDERGRIVPHQLVEPEPLMPDSMRLLFPLKIQSGGLRVLSISRSKKSSPVQKRRGDFRLSASHTGLNITHHGAAWRIPQFRLLTDTSDTWSHGLERFCGPTAAVEKWRNPTQVECGPLRWAWRLEGHIGRSTLCVDWRRYAEGDFWEMCVRVGWHERHRLLRLTWTPTRSIVERDDGIPGGGLIRAMDGAERPVRDRSLLYLMDGSRVGAVFPEIYSLSGDRTALHFTLLRSCPMAHWELKKLPSPLPQVKWTDQGDHVFTLRFFLGGAVSPALLDRHALALQQHPTVGDLTRGMPFRPYKDQLDRPL